MKLPWEKVNSLINKIGKGDKEALGELYKLTSGYLLNMARGYLGNKSSAEDVVSEVYLKVARYSGGFNEEKNGLNWLFKITKNTAYNFNLKNGRHPTSDLDALKDFAAALSTGSEYDTEKADLAAAVRTLPKEERELLYLRYWEGLTVRELAEKTGLPVMTAHDKLKKCLAKLKKLL